MGSDGEFDFAGRSRAIYSVYLRTVQVLMVDYEVLTGEFLTQVLNEIRSTFTHLARASVCEPSDQQKCEENVIKAERHVKRAILDCYKALCLAYFSRMKDFKSEYAEVDLTLADNGEFLRELNNRHNAASKCYVMARRADIDGTCLSEEEVFSLYEKAYLAYKELDDFRVESAGSLSFARSATDKNRKLIEENNELTRTLASSAETSDRLGRRSFWLGVFGAAMAIVSIVEGVILALL